MGFPRDVQKQFYGGYWKLCECNGWPAGCNYLEVVLKMDDLFDDEIDLFFADPDDEDFRERRKPSMSIPPSLVANMKTHMTKNDSEKNKLFPKNKYVEKLKEYVVDSHPLGCKVEDGVSLCSMGKRQRNRLAAKQSRDRKKLYIELMEREHKKLQEHLRQTNRQIEEIKRKINKFAGENKTIGGFTKLSQLEKRLERILREDREENAEEEINIILDSIRFRVGATGKERINKVQECFKQITNLSFPAMHRYLIWAATQNTHLFIEKDNKDEVKADEFLTQCYSIVPEIEGMINQLRKIQPKIVACKDDLIELTAEMKRSKDVLEQKNSQLDDAIDTIRDFLTPEQVAKIVIWVSKWKLREQINFFKFAEDPAHQLPRKRHKKDQQ